MFILQIKIGGNFLWSFTAPQHYIAKAELFGNTRPKSLIT